MPTPTLVQGAPCWIDLYSSDTDSAKDFYGRLFGWTTLDPGPEYGGYFIFQKDGKAVAGCMGNDGEQGYPDSWTVYLTTDDADRTAADAAANGGQVRSRADGRHPERPLRDDLRPRRRGDRRLAAARGEGLRDSERARHRRLVRAAHAGLRQGGRLLPRRLRLGPHTAADEEDFRYTTLGEGENALAGIMDDSPYPEDTFHSGWVVYFSVDDVDATLEQVEALGGKIERPAEDTPYGRMAACTDPTGTRFKLLGR